MYTHICFGMHSIEDFFAILDDDAIMKDSTDPTRTAAGSYPSHHRCNNPMKITMQRLSTHNVKSWKPQFTILWKPLFYALTTTHWICHVLCFNRPVFSLCITFKCHEQHQLSYWCWSGGELFGKLGWWQSVKIAQALGYAYLVDIAGVKCHMILRFETKCINSAPAGCVTQHRCMRYALHGLAIIHDDLTPINQQYY